MTDTFQKVATLADVPEGSMFRVELAGKRLLICNDAGKLYAVDEMCSHEDYSLFLGCIRDGRIKCSLHGSWFDMATGEPTAEPADEPICTYALKVAGEDILVDPGCRGKKA